jgi:3,4-dihydroxy 2-butanone 4-phosphate synthase/GTP cyclohydrolase II
LRFLRDWEKRRSMTTGPPRDGDRPDVDSVPASSLPVLDDALRAFSAGRIVVVSDGEDRENEADLVVAADAVDETAIGFIVRHTGGLLCVPVTAERAEQLELKPMVEHNSDPHGTAFTVSVDHVSTGTGISAADRARTIRALADTDARPNAFRRPGHVFPLIGRSGGVLKRAGHTEAALDLARLTGRGETAVISELVSDDGQPLRHADAARFAAEHGLAHITIVDLQRFRRTHDRSVERTAESGLPTAHGLFRVRAYRSRLDGTEHIALTLGDVAWSNSQESVLVRMHSECLTGDVLGSQRCDCGAQLDEALRLIAAEGRGVLVYLRGHEGRGIGLSHKLRAYALQEQGLDTVDANLQLGLPVDSREYGVGAHILADLGVRRIRLLTNNPAKYSGLAGYDLEITERVSLRTEPVPSNLEYLTTKQRRLGHDLGLAAVTEAMS